MKFTGHWLAAELAEECYLLPIIPIIPIVPKKFNYFIDQQKRYEKIYQSLRNKTLQKFLNIYLIIN